MSQLHLKDEQKYGCCPQCNTNWDGGEIFQTFRDKKEYKELTDDKVRELVISFYGDPKAHFSKLIGIEERGVYDGSLYWLCPNCKIKIHRWSPDTQLYNLAKQFGAKTFEEAKLKKCNICAFNGNGPCLCMEG